MECLSCKSIIQTYKAGFTGKKKIVALNQVSFQVEQHEVFGIIGPNGAGKSTILKVLMGFIKPDQGTALVNGKTAGSTIARSHIGYLPEHPSLYPHLSPQEHLQFSCRVSGISRSLAHEQIQSVLQTVGLSEVGGTPVKCFSKGMTQRAALAYALLHNPPILILDEPMSGLDPLGRQLVIEIIQEIHSKGTTILFCSHILSDVERICDRIAIMNKGRLVATTTPQGLKVDYPPLKQRGSRTPLEAFFHESLQADKT